MEEQLLTLGAGGGGGLIGALVAWFGIRSRLDAMEKSLEARVTEKECAAAQRAQATVASGLSQRIDNSVERFTRIDANIERIRQMLETARHRTDRIDTGEGERR